MTKYRDGVGDGMDETWDGYGCDGDLGVDDCGDANGDDDGDVDDGCTFACEGFSTYGQTVEVVISSTCRKHVGMGLVQTPLPPP